MSIIEYESADRLSVSTGDESMNAAICTTRFTSFGYPRYFMAWAFSACRSLHCDASDTVTPVSIMQPVFHIHH